MLTTSAPDRSGNGLSAASGIASLCCSRQGGRVAIHIPYARKPNFLRARARRLREIASTAQTILSDQLRMMAEELETRADELERAYPSSNDGS